MVKIGTPLTKVAKKALLCGSGELGKEVAIELRLIAAMFCQCLTVHVCARLLKRRNRI